MTKRKNKIFIALLCVIMVIGSAASALADGGSDAGIGKPAEDGGNPANAFNTSGGKLSAPIMKNGKYQCLTVPAKYANTITSVTTAPKSTSKVIKGETRDDLKIKFHYKDPDTGENTHEEKTLGDSDDKYTFNLNKQTKGETAILYQNYLYTNFTTGEKTLIDVKATLNGWDYKKHKVQLNDNEGSADAEECKCSGYGYTAPYLAINKNLTQGFPKTTTVNVGDLNIKYEFFKAGTDTRIKLSSSITYYDIDDNQALSYHDDNVKYIAVTPNTKLNYAKDGDWHVFIDPNSSKKSSELDVDPNDPKNCAAAAFEGYGIGIKYTAAQHDPKGEKSWGKPHGARAAFAPAPYPNQIIQFEMPEPVKIVYDGDGVTKKGEGDETSDAYNDGTYDGKENTVATPKNKWKYNIYQYIPRNFHPDKYKLSSFVIHDQFDGNNFEIVNGKDGVTVACGGVDKTGSFDINVTEAGKLTVTAKSTLFNNEDFYKTVKVNFTMKVKDGKSLNDLIAAGYKLDNDGFIQMKNEAWSVVKDGGGSDVTTRDSNNNPVKSTTKTNIGSKKPKKNPLWKFVSDKDNVTLTGNGSEDYDWHMADNKKENTIEKMGSDFTYHLINTIPPDYSPVWYYDSYEMTDTVPALVKIDRSKVRVYSVTYTKNENNTYTYSDLTDITNQFDATFTNDDRTITVSAKEAALKSASFYDNKRILLQFGCNIDTANYNTMSKVMPWFDKSAGKAMLTWENKGKLTVRDKETSVYEGTDAIHNAPVYTAESNEVKTHVKIPKPKKNAPTKEVSDSDNRTLTGTGAERNVTENTLDKVGETYTYHIKHKVKDDEVEYLPLWYFKSYKITDKVADLLLIQDGAKVYEGSTDVTSKYDISVSADKHTITATAKAAEIAKAEFYGKTYELRFDVKIDRDKYKTESQLRPWIDSKYGGRILTWLNNATVNITDEVDPSDPNSENGKGTWSKRTNDTTTHIQLPKPKKNVPTKQVTDKDGKTLTGEGDEIRVNENTLRKADNVYTYHVRHRLGSGVNDVWDEGAYASYWFFKNYKMSDTVEDLLLIQNADVYAYTWSKDNPNPQGNVDASDGTKVTDKFNIEISPDKKTVTATAKPGSLTAEDFYNVKLYELRFTVKIDTEKYDSEKSLEKWAYENNKGTKNLRIRWENKAKVDISDNVDPYYPDTEDGRGTWSKETNKVYTNLWIPRNTDKPGIIITKTTNPYEFQVGENIPYTITLKHDNSDAVAYKVIAKDTEFPKGFHIDEKSFNVTLSGKHAKREGDFKHTISKVAANNNAGEGFVFNTDYLYHGETITIKFNGIADKTINGTIVPNEVVGRAWGTHDKSDESTWDRAHTSVYINSPKADITKSVEKESRNPNAKYKTGDTIQFKSVITNKNPGTFLRNIYAVDTSETQGLVLNPSSITIQCNTRTDRDRFITLDKGTDYKIETYDTGKTIPMDRLGMKIGGREVEDYTVETATKEENEKAEAEKGTGAVLPTENNGGFIIKFIGKYRNLGYMDKTIPATNEERGKTAKYLADSLKAVEQENGVNYTTDYANLDLQNKFVITYTMTIEDEELANKEIANFIRVPSTENTNNNFIVDNDDLYVKGSPKVASGGDYARWSTTIPVTGEPEKDVMQKTADKGAILNYTIAGKNTGEEIIKDPELVDEVLTKNLEYNKDLKVTYNGKDITSQCDIKYEEYKFTIKANGINLQPGEKLVGEYTAKVSKDIKVSDPDADIKKLTAEYVVNNKVTFLGKNDYEWVPHRDVVEPNPQVTKTIQEDYTSVGAKVHYTVEGSNTEGTANDVVFEDVVTTKNLEYSKDIRVYFGKVADDKEITKDCKITYKDNTFRVETGRNLNSGEKIILKYTGTVLDVKDVKSVDNTVTLTGSNFAPKEDNAKVPIGGPEPEKEAKVPNTWEGKVIPYESSFINTDDDVWRDVVITDEILTKNAKYNEDFVVIFDGQDVTKECKFTYDNFTAKINTGKDLPKGKKIEVKYSITALNGDWIDNKVSYITDTKSAVAYEYVPPVTHEKEVKETEHDGPEGVRNTLHYTLTSKHNGTKRPLKNVVITDTVKSKNMTYNDDIKVMIGEEDVTKDCDIKIAEDKMSFEIKLSKDLDPGKTITTTYSGKVSDKFDVDNETILTADDVDGIKDDEHVPGPGAGHFVTVYKSSDPVTESKVKAGDTITYILKAVNSGGSTVDFTHIRDYIPAGTTFESVQNDGAFVSDKNYVEWVVKDLKPGAEKTVTFKVKVNTKDTPKHIYNHALYEEKAENPGNPGSIKDDPKLKTRYTHHYTEEPLERTVLVGVKSCEPASGSEVKVGDNVKYIIKVDNQGSKDTETAGIRDYIPEGTQFVSAENGGKYNADKNCVDWSGLSIKAKGSTTVSFIVKVTDEAKKLGRIENQALYQDEWTKPEIDPANSTNIVEHFIKMIDKKTTATSSQKGKVLSYETTFKNNKRTAVTNVKLVDTIKTKNAKFNNDFKVYINDKEVKASVNIDGYTATVSIEQKMNPKDVAKMVYSVTSENSGDVDNDVYEIDNDGRTDPDGEEIPGIDHKKDVKENQHDGPDGQINTLNYTLTSTNHGKHTIKNVVITDEVLSKNFIYNKDVKVILGGNDITRDCVITYTEFGFKIETGKTLKGGEVITTTYSGKVTNKAIVSNETVLRADDIDGIKDQEHVPGPEDGVYVTTRKTSEPPSGSIVKEGDEITYILTATNTGKDVSKFTQIRDEIPEGTTFKEVHDNGAFVKESNYVEWVVANLKPNESKSVKFTVTVNKDAPKEIWNVAYYRTYPEDPGKPGEIPTAPDKRTEETVHYTDEEHDTHPLLRAVKSSEPVTGSTVKVGDKIKYFIELENYGDADAKNAVIRDYIPEGTKFVSAENEGKYSEEKGYVDWYPLNVKAGEKVKVAFTVEVTKEALEKMVVENQALYQNDFELEKGKDPSSETNIVEHPIIEPDKPTDDTKSLDEPIKADEPTTPEEPIIVDEPETPKEELKPDTAIEHNKAVKESVTAKDKILHYELTTNILTDVEDVIITDEVTSKNLAYNKNSIKVYYNGDDITKNVEIQVKEHSFLIKTGIDAIQEDEFKVTYEGKATNNKTVKNTSSAYGKDVDPVKSSVKVDPAKSELSHEKNKAESSAKTGDNMPIGIAAALLIISAIIAMILLFKRKKI